MHLTNEDYNAAISTGLEALNLTFSEDNKLFYIM